MTKHTLFSDTNWNRKTFRVLMDRTGRIFFLLIFLLSLVGGTTTTVKAAGNVTLDGSVSTATADDVSSISINNHTTGTGDNRLMLVGVSWNSTTTARTIDTVKFSYGTEPTEETLDPVIVQKHGSNYRYTAIYSLLDPPSGETGTVTVNFSGGTVTAGVVVGVANFAGVDQLTPLGVSGGAFSPSNNTTPTVTLNGLNGDELVFDTVFLGGNPPVTLTVGTDQTELNNWNTYIANTRGSASLEQVVSDSVTMSWTAASNSMWVIAAVAINPVAGPTQGLTMAVSPTGSGTTVPGEGDHTYPQNEVVDISATPNVGYVFDSWTGDVADSGSANTTVTMDADQIVTANFTAQDYDLAITVDGNGSTDPAADVHAYGAGAVVDITATPDPGYEFDHWDGDCTGTGTCQVTMDGNKSVTAYFVEGPPIYLDGLVSINTTDDIEITEISHTTGTGTNRLMLVGVSWNSGTTARAVDSVTFTYGAGPTVLTFDPVITEQTGTQFRYSAIYSLLNPPSGQLGQIAVDFSGPVSNGVVAGVANFAGADQGDPLGPSDGANGDSTAPSLDLTGLDGDELVFDNVFQGASDVNQTLTPGADQDEAWTGWIANTRASASTEQAAGGSVTMSWTATSSSYWAITAVAINPVSTDPTIAIAGTPLNDFNSQPGIPSAEQSYTVSGSNLTDDITITAPADFEISETSGGGWTSSLVLTQTGGTVDATDIYVRFNRAASGTSSGDIIHTSSGATQRDVAVSGTATPVYTITATAGANGSIDPSGDIAVTEGDNQSFTITPNICYQIADVLVDDVSEGVITSYEFTNVMGSHTIEASFEALPPGTPCYRVNAGGDTLDLDPDPDFQALHYSDLDSIPGLTVTNVQDERSTTDAINMTNVDPGLPMELFQTILIRGTAGQTMTFDFEVSNGDYNVLLHMADHYFTEAGQRIFDVSLEGTEVLSDYDIFVAAGGEDIAVTETLSTAVSDGVLSLAFTAQTSDVAIRGIEIVPAEVETFSLNYTAGPGGSLIGELSQVVDYGEDGTLVEAVADPGYHFVDWSDGSTDNPRTDTNVTENVDVTANFEVTDTTNLYVSVSGSDSNPGTEAAPFATIQKAVNEVAVGGTIHVAAGTYIENVIIDKSLTLAGAGVDTIVQPAVSNPNPCTGSSMCGGAASNVLLVQTDDVVIHDLTVDGDNPALTGLDVGGANVDARNGIIKNTDATYNNLEVYNVTVKNIYLRGIYSTNGSFNFHNNTVTNVQGDSSSIAMFAWGGPGVMEDNTVSYANDAISANHSNGIQFLNNVMTHSLSGVHTDNSGDGGGVADLIQGNSVDCTDTPGAYGVWVFVPYIAPTVNDNTVTNCDVGLSAWGQGAAVNTQFTNNTVTGNLAAGSVGAYITTDLISWGYSDVSINFSGNEITGFETGVFLAADEQSWNPEPYEAKTIDATFHLNQISGNTAGADKDSSGIYLADFERNWWGDATGPNSPVWNGSGDTVSAGFDYSPWCANAACTEFAEEGYILTIVSEHGTVSKTPDQATYHLNDVVSLEAIPAEGWYFTGWSGNASGTDNPTTVTITGDMSVTASFEIADTTNLFVDVLGSDTNPGTEAAPFATIQKALEVVTEGGTIHVGAGMYNEMVLFADSTPNGLTIQGSDPGNRPEITGGIRFTNTGEISGLTLNDLVIKGDADTHATRQAIIYMANSGAVNNLAIDHCVLDGESIAVLDGFEGGGGRNGFVGNKLSGSFSVTNSEFKNILGWALLDMDASAPSPYGGSELALTSTTFSNNNVHDSNGTVSLRGNHTTRTPLVTVNNNTWDNIGGVSGHQGGQWAAVEVNNAAQLDFQDNTINDVQQGYYGEGQAVQLWNVETLNFSSNTITNNYQGIYYYSDGVDGNYCGSFGCPVPGGSISFNKIYGNSEYGISVNPTASGGPLNAEKNWWGAASGPADVGLGAEDKVSANVDYDPWCTDEDCTTFGQSEYTLTYTAGSGGTLTGETSQTVNYGGDGAPVEALPDPGYRFVEWSDGSTDNPRTDTNITANLDVSASFVLDIVTHSITLEPGWNLVSFNVHPEDTAVGTVLSSVDGSYDLVYAWDSSAASANWMKYDPDAGFGNSLTALDETMGFWIHMTAPDVLDVVGNVPDTTEIDLSTNGGGWNLVAYPSMANQALPGALSDHGVGDEFSLVYAYHAADTGDPWKLFDREAELPIANDLTELAPGWGYWVKVSADNSWNVGYWAP